MCLGPGRFILFFLAVYFIGLLGMFRWGILSGRCGGRRILIILGRCWVRWGEGIVGRGVV